MSQSDRNDGGLAHDYCDQLRFDALELLRVLGTSSDDESREEYVYSVLKIVFQRGQIEANAAHIARNDALLKARSDTQ